VALKLKLIRIEDVVELIEETPEDIELILTGRGAPREILQSADLVSEIKEIKHYFRKGIKARKGIEY
jgi:cob(I)alamin adenosyltransferase